MQRSKNWDCTVQTCMLQVTGGLGLGQEAVAEQSAEPHLATFSITCH